MQITAKSWIKFYNNYRGEERQGPAQVTYSKADVARALNARCGANKYSDKNLPSPSDKFDEYNTVDAVVVAECRPSRVRFL